MDAQERGRAGDIDPADQWVFDPNTGNYELRLGPSTEESAAPTSRRASRRATPAEEGTRRRREVPPQRGGRRAAGGRGTPPGSSRRKPKPQPTGKKKAMYWTGGVMAFVLVAGGTGAYFVYQHFNGNLNTVDIGDAGSGDAIPDGPMNILVLGTDVRTGKGNEGYGDSGSVGHADTTILFHVSEDRSNATALSIPRDLITDIPDCPTKQKDGSMKVIPGTPETRFNSSLGQEGRDPGCTMRTVKKLTGLQVDHFMMADFNAVKTLTSAVNGVDVCLGKDIDDPDSHLKLSKGLHTLKGEQALAFVRTRHSVGLGGDLSRIELQQQFLSSMIRKMKSNDTLTDTSKLWKLADAATKALTVDTGIGSIKKLSDLGRNLSGVDTKNITFATLPVIDNPAENVPSTVVLNKQPAEQLFAMMRADNSLTEVKKKAKAREAARLKGPKADPSEVRVEVLNGGGPFGAAQDTVDWMQNTEGVLKSSNGGNAPGPKQEKTTLEYAPNQADQARRLADMMGMPASALRPGTKDAEPTASMKLTLGADFKGAGTPLTAPEKAPEGVQKVHADKEICAK
ncbi:LCP family glycopolymer transferase [Streptomyces sp. 8N706]|uniref:LCP family glycopolymer transferase n=1 Tax=Streptomyces sp. 8N706 TaxID=3457416 RepID=UPI003FD61F7B